MEVLDADGEADEAVGDAELGAAIGGTLAWVMIAGCSIRDSTPPRDSARVKIWQLERKRREASRPPARTKLIMPPKPVAWRRARLCCGCEGRPG